MNRGKEQQHTWEVKIEGAKHISATEGNAVKEEGGWEEKFRST